MGMWFQGVCLTFSSCVVKPLLYSAVFCTSTSAQISLSSWRRWAASGATAAAMRCKPKCTNQFFCFFWGFFFCKGDDKARQNRAGQGVLYPLSPSPYSHSRLWAGNHSKRPRTHSRAQACHPAPHSLHLALFHPLFNLSPSPIHSISSSSVFRSLDRSIFSHYYSYSLTKQQHHHHHHTPITPHGSFFDACLCRLKGNRFTVQVLRATHSS